MNENKNKHERMVSLNAEKNHEKESIALAAINRMLQDGVALSIAILCKETGLSRSFYYTNRTVSSFLQEAMEKQSRSPISMKKQEIISRTAQRTIELLKAENEKLMKENLQLKKELEGAYKSLLNNL